MTGALQQVSIHMFLQSSMLDIGEGFQMQISYNNYDRHSLFFAHMYKHRVLYISERRRGETLAIFGV